jgi:Na+/H+ antiporter NhaD/arsenite permease-like protein
VDLTSTPAGLACLAIIAAAYAAVVFETRLRLRKSVPVTIAAGCIWALVAAASLQTGQAEAVRHALERNLLAYGELFFFLLSAITFVNTLEERQVFDALRSWLIRRGLGLRSLFWVTGGLAFCLSPFLDNLTTTLVMGSVAIAIGAGNGRFVTAACINIVVAANAGGVVSPFGDITTLMVWQSGRVTAPEFLRLLAPAAVNWLVPAVILSASIARGRPAVDDAPVSLRPGARVVMVLFALTIALTVGLHHFLHLPAALGMMTGLGCLKLYSQLLLRPRVGPATDDDDAILAGVSPDESTRDTFDIFRILERVEWDTLMFFYGVIVCVGGLQAAGYLAGLSHSLYGGLGPTWANTAVGVASAIVDNIPVMYAVLEMGPHMSHAQWLLVTLTAGVGGSLLSIGSAAGVALMGQARGVYTFASHLRWSWAVALGYAASIGVHLLISGF